MLRDLMKWQSRRRCIIPRMSENNPPVRYSIIYQQWNAEYALAEKDDEVDDILVVGSELALLPNVGDYVDYANSINGDLPSEVRRPVIKGKVRSRIFVYRRITGGQVFCHINIVVEPIDVDSRALINE